MTNRSAIVLGLVFAMLIFAVVIGLRYAEGAEMIGAEGAKRAMQVLIGLGFAAYANIMPKQLWRTRSASPRAEAWTQAALRVGGWSLMLAGLAYAGLWAFAPIAFAHMASKMVLASAVAITVGYALWSYSLCRGETRRSHPSR